MTNLNVEMYPNHNQVEKATFTEEIFSLVNVVDQDLLTVGIFKFLTFEEKVRFICTSKDFYQLYPEFVKIVKFVSTQLSEDRPQFLFHEVKVPIEYKVDHELHHFDVKQFASWIGVVPQYLCSVSRDFISTQVSTFYEEPINNTKDLIDNKEDLIIICTETIVYTSPICFCEFRMANSNRVNFSGNDSRVRGIMEDSESRACEGFKRCDDSCHNLNESDTEEHDNRVFSSYRDNHLSNLHGHFRYKIGFSYEIEYAQYYQDEQDDQGYETDHLGEREREIDDYRHEDY